MRAFFLTATAWAALSAASLAQYAGDPQPEPQGGSRADQSIAGQFVDVRGGVVGSAKLTAAPKGAVLMVDVNGLTPGWHGVHFHENADCSDGSAGFKASGGHVGHGEGVPEHGLLNPQGPEPGDLPNLYAHADGTARAAFHVTLLPMAALENGVAVVVHAQPDDQMTQPIGGAGDRVACAELRGRPGAAAAPER